MNNSHSLEMCQLRSVHCGVVGHQQTNEQKQKRNCTDNKVLEYELKCKRGKNLKCQKGKNKTNSSLQAKCRRTSCPQPCVCVCKLVRVHSLLTLCACDPVYVCECARVHACVCAHVQVILWVCVFVMLCMKMFVNFHVLYAFIFAQCMFFFKSVSYTHLRAHET